MIGNNEDSILRFVELSLVWTWTKILNNNFGHQDFTNHQKKEIYLFQSKIRKKISSEHFSNMWGHFLKLF